MLVYVIGFSPGALKISPILSPRNFYGEGSTVVKQVAPAAVGVFDDFLCVGFREPTFHDHFLVFQTLVVGKEICRRGDPVRVKVAKCFIFANVAHRHADDFVVLIAVVGYVQHGDRFDLHERAGLGSGCCCK